MNFLREHRLRITTLSPVHIGCDEDYIPTNYVIAPEESALYAFDSASALPDDAKDQLMTLVKGNSQVNILGIQKFFYKNRDPLIAKCSHFLLVAPGVADLYQKRIGKVAQRENTGGKVANKLEIERTFYNPVNQQPIIPGSSVKGAIRTALLNQQLRNKKTNSNQRENNELQKELFEYKNIEQDPMRLVHLADSSCEFGNEMEINSKVCFALNRPRRELEQGKSTMADGKGLYQLLETLPEFHTCESRLTIQSVEQIDNRDKLPSIYWNLDEIAKACNDFYGKLHREEMKILSDRNYITHDKEELMEKLLAIIEPQLESGAAMLLRVGRHSGAEAVTLDGVRNIKIMQGKGKPPKYKEKPRTLWLAADAQGARSDMKPFGWLLVEIDPSGELPEALKEIKQPVNAEAKEWREKQKKRIEELRNRLSGLEGKGNDEDEPETEMTETEQKIESLKKQYRQEKQVDNLKPGGPATDNLNKLLNEAETSDWSAKDITALCDFAEELYKALEMFKGFSGPKGRDRKDRIEKLRDSADTQKNE